MKSGTGIGKRARRQHDRSFKAGLVEQGLQPSASVAVIARNNGINANVLFKWRRDHKLETTAASMPTPLSPSVPLPVHVHVHVEPTLLVGSGVRYASDSAQAGVMTDRQNRYPSARIPCVDARWRTIGLFFASPSRLLAETTPVSVQDGVMK
jgi:transposase-like protein